MKLSKIPRAKSTYIAIVAIMTMVAIASCVYIRSFDVRQYSEDHPDGVLYAYAGTEATFVIDGYIECHEDHSGVQFVAAFLVPKCWNVAVNGKVSYKCTLAEDHDQLYTMSIIPASSLPKNGNGRTWVECLTQEYGVGTNVLDEMEWVVYQTDDKYNIINNQAPNYTIYLKTTVGDKNLKCHLGAFVNHTDDGFSGGTDHKKCVFSTDCFEVKGGSGMTLDFCQNHFNKVSPMSALQDDYISFYFNGDAADNALKTADNVYIQGVAYTAEGNKYLITEKSPRTLMKRASEYDATYSITVWPMKLFNVPLNEHIERVEYIFSNADGSITITQSDDDFVMQGIPMPEEKQPFTFVFECQ
ncbi:MAG: DUF4961 domain-containing protein [Bacteroidaceae bacterium]|nr:DUF4961 domain-containing protein [Bacteroidaceae bacterium]